MQQAPFQSEINRTDPKGPTQIPQPGPAGDYRFLRLIGLEAWQRLPADVRSRFSKSMSDGQSVVYQGRVIKTQLNSLGWLLARLTWVLGSPLPRDDRATGAAVVVVTQNPRTGAQNWVRTYARANGAMQTIASEKRFQGPTGLEEYVGGGIGMTLLVEEKAGTLEFRSARYFFEAGPVRVLLPRFLSPGEMTITHRDQGLGQFQFELVLEHALFGRLLYQLAEFNDGR